MKDNGFKFIFTSLQIPEEQHGDLFRTFNNLIDAADNLQVIADINPRLFKVIEEKVNDGLISPNFAVRFDESVSMDSLIRWGQHSRIMLNASTDALEILRELKDRQFDLSKVIVGHNYYPRPETGLDSDFFRKQNEMIKREFPDVSIMAFVPGTTKRGPIFEGLPTLEHHRNMNVLQASHELKNMQVDQVCIGDYEVSEPLAKQLDQYCNHSIISLRVKWFNDDYTHLEDEVFHNRKDVARDVVRAEEGRKTFNGHVDVCNSVERVKGSITLDNHLYGRYMNELQITRRDLEQHDAVNVIGQVMDEDLIYLDLIGSGTAFQFVTTEVDNEY